MPAPAFRVNIELLPAVTGFVPNDAEAPDGRPLTARVTCSAVPAVRPVLIDVEPCPPCAAVTVASLAPIEKLFCAQLANLTLAMFVSQVLEPVVL